MRGGGQRGRRVVGGLWVGKNMPSLGSRVLSTRSSAGEHNWRRRREHSPRTMDLTSCSRWASRGRGTRTRRRTGRTTRCSAATSSCTRLSCATDFVRSTGRARRGSSMAEVDCEPGDARYGSATAARRGKVSVCPPRIDRPRPMFCVVLLRGPRFGGPPWWRTTRGACQVGAARSACLVVGAAPGLLGGASRSPVRARVSAPVVAGWRRLGRV